MDTEIRSSEWPSFFDTFSRQHYGWLVTVEEIPAGTGAGHVEARALPLQGVSANPRDATISIAVGAEADRHLTHTIANPTHVFVEWTAHGAERGLRIERQGGPATRVRFRAAVRPEEVDGFV